MLNTCRKQVVHDIETSEIVYCAFFNTYRLHQDGKYIGQMCSMYTETWSVTHGNSSGQVRESGNYTISDSFIASNATTPRPVPTGEDCKGDGYVLLAGMICDGNIPSI
jgi:hypothetical protein